MKVKRRTVLRKIEWLGEKTLLDFFFKKYQAIIIKKIHLHAIPSIKFNLNE